MNSSTRQPNDHVLDLALDYLEGRLDPDQTDGVRHHLRQCDDCRADFDHAAALRGDAIGSGLRHIRSDRLIELSEGVQPSVQERDHLASCLDCDQQLQWARDLDGPPELVDFPVQHAARQAAALEANRRRFRPRLFQWGTLLAAAAVVVVLALPRGDDGAIRALADARALPVAMPEVNRGEPDQFSDGLAAYRAGDYSTARGHFEAVVAADPEHAEAQLYYGSTEFLLGNPRAAREHLTRAAELTEPEFTPETGAAAHYVLANVYLFEGDADRAREEFQLVLTIGGLFENEARSQLQKLDAAE